MNTTTKTTLGVIGATALGVTLGILFAPKKGKEIRENIQSSAVDAKDKTAESMKKFSNKISEVYDEVTDKVADKLSKDKTWTEKLATKAKSLV